MKYIWLIPLLPGIGAAINGLVGIRSFSRKTAGSFATAMMLAALGLALLAFVQLLGLPADARFYDVNVAEWIPKIPLATHDGIGDALAFAVLLAFQVVGRHRESVVVESDTGHHAGLAEHQHARTALRHDLQHNRGFGAFVAPVPVLTVNQMTFAGGCGQCDRSGFRCGR